MPDQEPQSRGVHSELAAFGEELRREREIRGISLKEISDATKISRRFLDAIERNDHRTLPAPVFTRGFVREYARYLGLNVEEMVNRYNSAAASDDRIEKPAQIARYPQTPVRDISPKPPRKRGIPPVWSRVDRNAVALVFIALALTGVAWWAVRQRALEHLEQPVDAPVTRAAKPAAPPAAQPKLVPDDDSTLRLSIEASVGSWVELEADGKTVLNAEMVTGELKNFEATREFRFRTVGNAAGLNLTLNGALIPPLGEPGEVIRNRVFDRDALGRLREPVAAADGAVPDAAEPGTST